MIEDINNLNDLKKIKETIDTEVTKYVVGWDHVLQSLLIGLFAGGHILLEGVPGTAKTYLAKIFSDCLSLSFRRIQFTPDLMPSDITGSHIFNTKNLEFDFIPGPIFANLVLVDEINRAPPKSQSALLECMQESQVTVDGKTSKLDDPFMIIATKNPIEFEGTFPLPAAQLDRFMSRLIMNYPPHKAWVEILNNKNERGETVNIDPIVKPKALVSGRNLVRNVEVKKDALEFIVDLVSQTRNMNQISLGASPTASVALLNASKGYAAVVEGRDNVTVEDVKAVALDVLNHRIVVKDDSSNQDGDLSEFDNVQNMLERAIKAV